jgi:RNA polymerase sigma factor (sigma-70 family)
MPNPSPELLPTRASLLDRMRDLQNQKSWQEFFDTYWKLIYGVARKSGLTDGEAQDVVQDVMASVAKHMPGFRYDPAIGSFKGWLLTKTRWCVIEQLRKRAKAAMHEPLPSDSSTALDGLQNLADPGAASIDEHWEAEWRATLLEAALNNLRRKLDPQKLQMFDFYVRKEWAAEKVDATFGVSVEQVYMAKHRITEALKEEVQRLENEIT